MILLIDNYDSFTFNLYQALAVLGPEVQVNNSGEFRQSYPGVARGGGDGRYAVVWSHEVAPRSSSPDRSITPETTGTPCGRSPMCCKYG